METIETKVRVECDQCDRELHTVRGESKRGTFIITVEPCPECLRRARMEALREEPDHD